MTLNLHSALRESISSSPPIARHATHQLSDSKTNRLALVSNPHPSTFFPLNITSLQRWISASTTTLHSFLDPPRSCTYGGSCGRTDRASGMRSSPSSPAQGFAVSSEEEGKRTAANAFGVLVGDGRELEEVAGTMSCIPPVLGG